MKIKIPVLVIGKRMDDLNQRRLEWLIRELGGRFDFPVFGPVYEEPDVLDSIAQIKSPDIPCLVIDVLQGGSARAITLAAIKSGLPSLIWCHDEKHSLASSAIAAGALRQQAHPCVLLHGETETSKTELVAASAAACAIQTLAQARIGQLGPLHFNLIHAAVNPVVLMRRFGSWVVPLSVAALKRGIRKIDACRLEKEIDDLAEKYTLNIDRSVLRKAMAFRLALKEITGEKRLDAVASDCWNEILPETGTNPCLGFAYDDFMISCEGDLVLAVALIAGRAIHGKPGYCGDLFSLDEATGILSLMHCSGCSALHGGDDPVVITDQQPPNVVDSADRLAVLQPRMLQEAGTLLLLHGENLEFLHLRRCEIVSPDFSSQMRVFVKIEDDIEEFRQEAAGNHYVVFPGDCTEAWKTWAKWSGLTVH
jgi:L-fucose isomerase-like protein